MSTETLEFIATGEKRQARVTSTANRADGYLLTTFTLEDGQVIHSRFNLSPTMIPEKIPEARMAHDSKELLRNGYRIWSDEAQAKENAEKPVHPDTVERIAVALEGIMLALQEAVEQMRVVRNPDLLNESAAN